MDLKKLFVYVPAAAESAFISSVINVPAEALKYANKIVFLESSHRIWAKGQYYGSDPAEVNAIWTALGIEKGTTPSGSYAVGESTFSYVNFAQWIGALKSYADAKIAAEKADVVSSYETADTAIISSYEAADSALNASYTAFKNKVGAIDALPGTLKEYIDAQDASARTEVKTSGSGISVAKTAGTDGHDIYTIVADQSIWEFMGSTTATAATVATVLNGQYDGPTGTGEGKVHRNPEQGDVWAVTITDQSNNVILYACDSVSGSTGTWTQIGSAQGISGVDTTASHGVGLTNTASVVGVTVNPGSIADGNDSVITGGAAYTAIAEEHAAAYAEAAARATDAQTNAYAEAAARATDAQTNAYAEAAARATDAQTNAYAEAAARATDAQTNAYAEAAARATDAQTNAYAEAAARATDAQTNAYAEAAAKATEAQTNAYAKIAAEKAEVVAAYQNADTAIISGYQNADTAIISGYQGADTAIISSYEAADSAIVTAYTAADTAIITAYQNADTALNNAYTAFKEKVGDIDSLTGTLLAYVTAHDASARTEVKVEGSGLSIQKSTYAGDGHDIYTITADQSIWEFCGTVETTYEDPTKIGEVLDEQYGTGGTGDNKKREHAEVGDVWAVKIMDTTGEGPVLKTTVLYACSSHTEGNPDTNTWVAIGAAEGIVDVDTSVHAGIALTKNAGIVALSVTPGSIADGNDSVITGGAAYTAINNAQANAYAYAQSEDNKIITGYQGEISKVWNGYTGPGEVWHPGLFEAASRIGSLENWSAALRNSYAYTAYVVDAAGTSYALYSYELIQGDDDPRNDGKITSAYVKFDETVMFNYVTDNIWETYSTE